MGIALPIRCAAVAAVVLSLAPARALAADPPISDEARAHVDKGAKLYEEGAYEAAVIELRRAHELSGNYKILYNVAVVENLTRDFAAALRDYQAYLQGGGAEIPAARRAEVQKEVERLVGLVGKLEVSGPEGAEARIDDIPSARLPMNGPVVLNPGKHRIVVALGGRESPPRLVTLAAGESARIEVLLPDKAGEPLADKPAPTGPLAPAAPAAPPAPAPMPVWPFWAATGALALGTAVVGGLALSKYGALKDARNDVHATSQGLSDLAGTTKTFALAADVLGGMTIVSAGVATVLTIRRPEARSAPVAFAVGPTGGSFTVRF